MPKIQSIKKDLIITLSALIAVVLITVRCADFLYTKHHNTEVLDANLVKSAKLIFSLIRHEVFQGQDLAFLSDLKPALQQKIYHRYEYKLHAQAWENDELIYNSDSFLLAPMPDYEGFRDIEVHDQTWRSFSFYDPKTKIRILVAEQDFVTNQVVGEIILSFAIPILLSFSLLFLIVIVTVNKKLRPFRHLATEIEKMSAHTLQQFQNPNIPIELKPFIESFNSLIQRLSDSIEAERNFTNYAAHELKTPLTAIMVQTHLLVSNKNKEKEKEYAQDLLNGINRATHLVNQLLTLSRLESDNVKIEQERFDLAELTKFVIANYLKKAEEKNLQIEFICQEKEQNIFIEANKTYIEVVVNNLLDNAIKYSTASGKIVIEIVKKNHALNFKISNSGEQILPEEIAKIFSNFYRVNRLEAKNKNVGCGLGLGIAKKIADLHHATISFSSVGGINAVEIEFPNIS